MRKLILVSLALLALLTAGGGRELTDVTLIQTAGVDGAGPLTVTAVGEDDGDRYRAQGGDLARAREGLREVGRTRLELTHVAQLVLGPEVPVEEVLWQELTHRDSGYGATVWLTDEPAGELLDLADAPCQRLKAMEENGSADPPTILEVLSALSREGEVNLPVLAREGAELRAAGTRTIRKEG